jgi:hypothetical protein
VRPRSSAAGQTARAPRTRNRPRGTRAAEGIIGFVLPHAKHLVETPEKAPHTHCSCVEDQVEMSDSRPNAKINAS